MLRGSLLPQGTIDRRGEGRTVQVRHPCKRVLLPLVTIRAGEFSGLDSKAIILHPNPFPAIFTGLGGGGRFNAIVVPVLTIRTDEGFVRFLCS